MRLVPINQRAGIATAIQRLNDEIVAAAPGVDIDDHDEGHAGFGRDHDNDEGHWGGGYNEGGWRGGSTWHGGFNGNAGGWHGGGFNGGHH